MLPQSASRYLRCRCAGARRASATEIPTPQKKSFPFVVRIKKKEEAGNRGVVCRRSGFCHGEVSNTDCLFVVVVVGFEAHTVCASTPFFASRRFSLFWKRFSSRSSKTFSGFVRFRRCARRRLFFTRKNRKEKIYRERDRKSHGTDCLRLDTDLYACARECVYINNCSCMCVCARAWFPNTGVAS